MAEDTLVGLGPWKFVEYVPGEYVRLVANRDYFRDPTVLLEQEIGGLTEQLSEAAEASEAATTDIASLRSQLADLRDATDSQLEDNSAEISALETQITALEGEVETLQGGLTSASNIGYASIAIAVIVGAIAIFMARREQ